MQSSVIINGWISGWDQTLESFHKIARTSNSHIKHCCITLKFKRDLKLQPKLWIVKVCGYDTWP